MNVTIGRASLLLSAALLAACEDDGAGAAAPDLGPAVGAGFSAALRADLATATGIPAPAPKTSSSEPLIAAKGAGPAPGAAASGKPAATVPASGAATVPASGAATAPASGKPAAAPAGAPSAAPTAGVGSGSGELSAIKLKLNEGWLRDSVGPGTFSFFAPGEGGKNIRFVFRYGFEEATAPLQRDAYIQWLASTKTMTVGVDRQRGAAWFLEGTDGTGEAVFRYVITYGGRLLVCSGSLYKQGPAAALRDLRDEILTQAKHICESMDL
jgi:hypothetical protein